MLGSEIMALRDIDLRFIDQYFECNGNATEAMSRIHPKWARRSAATEGWQALQKPDIREAIRIREIEERAKRRLTVDQFGDLLQEASTVDVVDFYNEDGTLKRLSEIPPHARRQIASIEPVTVEVWKKERDPETHKMTRVAYSEIRHKIKLWDLRKAQELWGKWKKMYTDKSEITGEEGGPLRVSISINGIKKGQGSP